MSSKVAANRSKISLPEGLPWQHSVGLLLDAVQVENLLQRLFEWADLPMLEVLYLKTRFAEFRDVSPCLVRLKGANDPILAQFLANLDQQWGYLLASDEPWEQMVAHLRWLTLVEHPSEEPLLLRIAYPPVADALFSSETASSRLFGPCQCIFTADLAHNRWHQYNRPGEMPPPQHDKPYRLSEKQWASLDDARFRERVNELHQHMDTYFPDYRSNLTAPERREHLHQLALSAIEQGFDSEKALWLYANILGFMDKHPHTTDPMLLASLNPHQPMPNIKRIEMLGCVAESVERRTPQ